MLCCCIEISLESYGIFLKKLLLNVIVLEMYQQKASNISLKLYSDFFFRIQYVRNIIRIYLTNIVCT